MKPFESSAVGIAAKINDKEMTPADVADFYLARVKKYAPTLNSHLHFSDDEIRTEISSCANTLKKTNNSLPLAGVPVLVKDNICVAGITNTCGSKILENFKPPYSATVIDRLRAAGAMVFGKANCDEFAMGSSNENSAYGPVRNPWDTERVPGGSSGGSAAGVAADLAPVSLGSDTGGSIRQPASFCGIVGLKPTYGRISRYGLVAFGSSLDQIGPMSRNAADAALLFDIMSGFDPRDSTSLNIPAANTVEALKKAKSLEGKTVGIVNEFFDPGLDKEVAGIVEAAVKQFESLGAKLKKISLPSIKYSIASYYVIATAEASANLARFDGIRYGHRSKLPGLNLKELYRASRSEGFGKEVKQRIMLGTFALSSGYYDAYYAKANRARYMIAKEFDAAFIGCDFLVSPTAPSTAFKIGEKSADPLAMYLSDIYTIGVNLAGIPAISIPCGFDKNGLPIGLQIMGPRLGEEKILVAAHLYEQQTRWLSGRHPTYASK